eukprot:12083638-Karenia_brevis.AAC.1
MITRGVKETAKGSPKGIGRPLRPSGTKCHLAVICIIQSSSADGETSGWHQTYCPDANAL